MQYNGAIQHPIIGSLLPLWAEIEYEKQFYSRVPVGSLIFIPYFSFTTGFILIKKDNLNGVLLAEKSLMNKKDFGFGITEYVYEIKKLKINLK